MAGLISVSASVNCGMEGVQQIFHSFRISVTSVTQDHLYIIDATQEHTLPRNVDF